MAAKKKAKKIVKGTASTNAIESAVASISDIASNTAKANITLSKEQKKLAAASKRMGKKRTTLMRKKKTASTKFKKIGDVASKKALKAIEKDLAAIRKESGKASVQKKAVSSELTEIRQASKRAAAYSKAVAAADKVLNKPKKKRRKKRAAKKTM